MTEFVAAIPGLCPLPDRAKSELADLKGHQKHDLVDGDESEEVAAAYGEVRRELVATQREAGLDLVVEGQARWDDMLAHPLAVHDAVETRGIVRYYDNNNFYREPVVGGGLAFDGDVAAELEAAAALTDDLQAVLPGPYTLADLATDAHYGDGAAFLDAVADFLAGEAAAFPEVAALFLLEPSLVANPPGGGDGVAAVGPERAAEAVEAVASAVDAPAVVDTYWDAFEGEVYAHLLDAGVGIGLDLVTAPGASASVVAEHGAPGAVALGVVDGQNTRLESPETIRERVGRFREAADAEFETVYATANTELFYLPVTSFEAKLEALAAATDGPLPTEPEEVRA